MKREFCVTLFVGLLAFANTEQRYSCTKDPSKKCTFPFEKDGETYYDVCAYSSYYKWWCYVDDDHNDWDYCIMCEVNVSTTNSQSYESTRVVFTTALPNELHDSTSVNDISKSNGPISKLSTMSPLFTIPYVAVLPNAHLTTSNMGEQKSTMKEPFSERTTTSTPEILLTSLSSGSPAKSSSQSIPVTSHLKSTITSVPDLLLTSTESTAIAEPAPRCSMGDKPCRFPFTYKGEQHNECITTVIKPWCYTSTTGPDYAYCTVCEDERKTNVMLEPSMSSTVTLTTQSSRAMTDSPALSSLVPFQSLLLTTKPSLSSHGNVLKPKTVELTNAVPAVSHNITISNNPIPLVALGEEKSTAMNLSFRQSWATFTRKASAITMTTSIITNSKTSTSLKILHPSKPTIPKPFTTSTTVTSTVKRSRPVVERKASTTTSTFIKSHKPYARYSPVPSLPGAPNTPTIALTKPLSPTGSEVLSKQKAKSFFSAKSTLKFEANAQAAGENTTATQASSSRHASSSSNKPLVDGATTAIMQASSSERVKFSQATTSLSTKLKAKTISSLRSIPPNANNGASDPTDKSPIDNSKQDSHDEKPKPSKTIMIVVLVLFVLAVLVLVVIVYLCIRKRKSEAARKGVEVGESGTSLLKQNGSTKSSSPDGSQEMQPLNLKEEPGEERAGGDYVVVGGKSSNGDTPMTVKV